MDMNTNRILISRNVVFHETNFTFKALPLNSEVPTFLFPHLEFQCDPISFNLNIPSATFNEPISSHINTDHHENASPNSHIRKPTRIKQTPKFLQDYYCGTASLFPYKNNPSTCIGCSFILYLPFFMLVEYQYHR